MRISSSGSWKIWQRSDGRKMQLLAVPAIRKSLKPSIVAKLIEYFTEVRPASPPRTISGSYFDVPLESCAVARVSSRDRLP